jgi:hypothetical protein
MLVYENKGGWVMVLSTYFFKLIHNYAVYVRLNFKKNYDIHLYTDVQLQPITFKSIKVYENTSIHSTFSPSLKICVNVFRQNN